MGGASAVLDLAAADKQQTTETDAAHDSDASNSHAAADDSPSCSTNDCTGLASVESDSSGCNVDSSGTHNASSTAEAAECSDHQPDSSPSCASQAHSAPESSSHASQVDSNVDMKDTENMTNNTAAGGCNSFAASTSALPGSPDFSNVSNVEMAQHAEASKHTRHAAEASSSGRRPVGQVNRQAAAVGLDTSHLPAILRNEQAWYDNPLAAFLELMQEFFNLQSAHYRLEQDSMRYETSAKSCKHVTCALLMYIFVCSNARTLQR